MRFCVSLAIEVTSRPRDTVVVGIPELETVCIGDDECEVGPSVRELMLEWLESNDAAGINVEQRGRRIFRYNADAIIVSTE